MDLREQYLEPVRTEYVGKEEHISPKKTKKTNQSLDRKHAPTNKTRVHKETIKFQKFNDDDQLVEEGLSNSLAFLPPAVLKNILSMLGAVDLLAVLLTQRFMRAFIIGNVFLKQKLLSLERLYGAYLFIEGTQSTFMERAFYDLFEQILETLPQLVIRCDIAPCSSSAELQTTVNDVNTFALQSLTPGVRKYAHQSFMALTDKIVEGVPLPAPETPESIKRQPWFVNTDRKEVESMLLQEPDNTFCLRPSSVAGSYALTHKKNHRIAHSLIAPWKKWYFSGIENEGAIRGLFFSSLSSLVWYWKTMGLDQKWTPLHCY